jgi:hypothetical protein
MLAYQVRAVFDPSFAPKLRRIQIGKLKKIGAFTRRAMRSLMKRKSGPSEPGKAPHVHGEKLKGRTLFAVDEEHLSVVTGTATASSVRGRNVAQILNEGGRSVVSAGFNTGKSIYVAPRPWTVPAQQETLPAIGRILKE